MSRYITDYFPVTARHIKSTPQHYFLQIQDARRATTDHTGSYLSRVEVGGRTLMSAQLLKLNHSRVVKPCSARGHLRLSFFLAPDSFAIQTASRFLLYVRVYFYLQTTAMCIFSFRKLGDGPKLEMSIHFKTFDLG